MKVDCFASRKSLIVRGSEAVWNNHCIERECTVRFSLARIFLVISLKKIFEEESHWGDELIENYETIYLENCGNRDRVTILNVNWGSMGDKFAGIR